MEDNLNKIFKTLEPPPDGLSGLRSKLAHSRRRKATRKRIFIGVPVTLASAAAAIALIVTLWPNPSSTPPGPVRQTTSNQNLAGLHPGLISLGIESPPNHSVTVPRDQQFRVAVTPVSESEEVLFYMVDTTGGAKR